MTRLTVPPRDLQPGDQFDRINLNMDFALVTVREVRKVRNSGHTAYKIYLAEYDALPDNQKPWATNRHLAPFILQPYSRVTVERPEV